MTAQITAKIIAHSINPEGKELYSIEAVAPYILDAEIEKHGMICSNSSSNRAIPFNKMIEANYYIPQDIRKNQKGMQGFDTLKTVELDDWNFTNKQIRTFAVNKLLAHEERCNTHKQHLNRIIAPWSMQKKILTGTKEAWEGVMSLRNHPDADPSIQIWAKQINGAMLSSMPTSLDYGEWHLPYITKAELAIFKYGITTEEQKTVINNLLIMSTARCARTSYRLHDGKETTFEADKKLFDMLVGSDPKHETPLEHQALCVKSNSDTRWIRGMTHMMRDGSIGSGRLIDWVQHRHWR